MTLDVAGGLVVHSCPDCPQPVLLDLIISVVPDTTDQGRPCFRVEADYAQLRLALAVHAAQHSAA